MSRVRPEFALQWRKNFDNASQAEELGRAEKLGGTIGRGWVPCAGRRPGLGAGRRIDWWVLVVGLTCHERNPFVSPSCGSILN